jgi:hypothetical protein
MTTLALGQKVRKLEQVPTVPLGLCIRENLPPRPPPHLPIEKILKQAHAGTTPSRPRMPTSQRADDHLERYHM